MFGKRRQDSSVVPVPVLVRYGIHQSQDDQASRQQAIDGQNIKAICDKTNRMLNAIQQGQIVKSVLFYLQSGTQKESVSVLTLNNKIEVHSMGLSHLLPYVAQYYRDLGFIITDESYNSVWITVPGIC